MLEMIEVLEGLTCGMSVEEALTAMGVSPEEWEEE